MSNFSQDGAHEKRSAAMSSVMAGGGLTGFKIIVGLTTGSLGILAEAAHSGLDLMAAVMTFLAVRISGKPADRNHLYGHGKAENLSALFETLLLLVTCFWILYEATHRLLYHAVVLKVTFWSFTVMITSIVVDISRSRILYRAARKYNSQALEADALHFSTDIWSSGVVILGLFFVKLSQVVPGLAFFHQADSVAAIMVGLIVVYVSIKLGIRTIQALLDVAPSGIEKRIISALEVLPDVKGCHNVRVRCSGPQLFVDIHILVDGNQTLKEAHNLTEEIEHVIQKLMPNADVTVHPEPTG
ncbi:MAG: cation transporter [Deltaproteobacteria bacterium CG_4_8_14_3_um_filter_45_9]|nr:MAG: cation transporter [Deltaproteobacteria bacterium CG03_land_8_20_14_0_80_45_14]PIX24549.1 MAG: cation transporter [Deltaproteobacteria bacterium CG_4_8_14_3_um_filter_45_9]